MSEDYDGMKEAAQVAATYQAGGALARAYDSLRDEMLRILAPDALAELRGEFLELFPTIEEPPNFSPALPRSTGAKLEEASNEAQVRLRMLQGWIQGLIDEMTLDQRMRLEAEAKAAQANRPMGFAG